MHHDEGRAGRGNHAAERRLVTKPAHIVHDGGAFGNGGRRDLGLVGVDGNRDAHASTKTRDDRQHTPGFFGRRQRFGPRTRGLSADVDDIGAACFHLQGELDRGLGVGSRRCLGKRVGRDVQDAHDERPGTQLQDAPAGKWNGVETARGKHGVDSR